MKFLIAITTGGREIFINAAHITHIQPHPWGVAIKTSQLGESFTVYPETIKFCTDPGQAFEAIKTPPTVTAGEYHALDGEECNEIRDLLDSSGAKILAIESRRLPGGFLAPDQLIKYTATPAALYAIQRKLDARGEV